MNATGVVYTPGVCRGQTMPSRTLFGVHYIHDRRGYSDSVRSIGKAVVGRNGGRADEDTPLFYMWFEMKSYKLFWRWVSAGEVLLKADDFRTEF